MRKLRKDQVVAVEILDHCENHDVPMPCTVWGKVVKVADNYFTVRCWEVREPSHDNNCTDYTIVKSCVTSVTVFD